MSKKKERRPCRYRVSFNDDRYWECVKEKGHKGKHKVYAIVSSGQRTALTITY